MIACAAHADSEITSVDLTTVKNLRGDRVTVFGTKLGMTHAEAKAILDKNPKLTYKVDGSNPDRIYVNGAAGGELFYLIWEPGKPKLTRITIFRDFTPFLVGETKQLMTTDAITEDSKLAREFLGKATSKKVTLDVPSIQLKHVTYWFDKRWMAVTHQMPEGRVVFAFESPDYVGPGNSR
jgi:hypothetical protein